ncbi:MAG: LysR substrate-binding domain-containing protein [Bacteroidota bacterium]
MTINQLQYALMLGKHRNFKRAADHLEISQPALSLQMQKLEDEIGFKLFNRNASPIRVTEDGKLFLVKAQEVMSGILQLQNFTSEIKEDYSGRLKVGIIPTLAPFLVALFIESLETNYPELQLIIHEQITEQVINNVRTGELDVGIISTPIDSYGIRSMPLFYEKFFVYTAEGKSALAEFQIEDIKSKRLWLLDEGNCFRDQINDFCDIKSNRKGKNLVYQSNSIDSLIRIVDAKGGITILPELTSLALSGDQEENLKPIGGKPKAREISMVVTNNLEKERYLNVLADTIKSNIPHHMLEGSSYEIVDPNIQIR